jgi:hypothetical protein
MTPVSDVVVPRTTVLPLLGGRSITVREELNHGQHTAMQARKYRETEQGELRLNAHTVSDAIVIAYLVDWTLTDQRGKPIAIMGLPPNELQDVLNNLRQPVAEEVKRAIQAHDAAANATAEALKKTESTDAPSPSTSPSAGQPA